MSAKAVVVALSVIKASSSSHSDGTPPPWKRLWSDTSVSTFLFVLLWQLLIACAVHAAAATATARAPTTPGTTKVGAPLAQHTILHGAAAPSAKKTKAFEVEEEEEVEIMVEEEEDDWAF
ncbi:hypothetical protein F5X99DRAFT_411115 [Biscogniauxia marginata]|nr:hypothetical protein F5X99DRAFT_411115 [Biscogniauxia marginata]